MSMTTARGPKNFVARLVDLASGSAEIGMPRLPSLFEPASGRSNPRAPDVAGAEGLDGFRSASTQSAGENQSEAVLDSFDVTPRDDARDAHRQDSGMRSFQVTSQLHAIHARNDNPAAAMVPVYPRAAARQYSDAGPPPSERVAADRGAPAPGPVERHGDPAPAHRDSGPVTDRSADAVKHPPGMARRQTDNAPATGEEPKRQGTLNSRHLPVFAPTDSLLRGHEPESARASAARAEPVVHVSIGRVEVRASLPAAAPARTKQRQPMSLDDYLRQRSGAR